MPRRWSDLDSDEHRLPQGFKRTGYDADERRYYFSDGGGQTWRSQPGNAYGVLTPVEPEPPVTIPRRCQQQPPPYSKEPTDDPPPRESTSLYRHFTDILSSQQITSASSSIPKRSHTINIPAVASLKRSSTAAASFIRSRGKHLTKSGHSKEPSHDDDSQRSPRAISHWRSASVLATIGRSATTATSYMRGKMRQNAEDVNEEPRPAQEADRDKRN